MACIRKAFVDRGSVECRVSIMSEIGQVHIGRSAQNQLWVSMVPVQFVPSYQLLWSMWQDDTNRSRTSLLLAWRGWLFQEGLGDDSMENNRPDQQTRDRPTFHLPLPAGQAETGLWSGKSAKRTASLSPNTLSTGHARETLYKSSSNRPPETWAMPLSPEPSCKTDIIYSL